MKALVALLLLTSLLLAGCGLKGPLYLPSPASNGAKTSTDQKK